MEIAFPKTSSRLAGFIITFTGAILFSTKAIIVKKAYADTSVDVLTLLALRMLFSLPFYVITALIVHHKAGGVFITRRQWTAVVCMGLFGYYLSSWFDFLGLQYISAGLERLILFLYPTFVVLLNAAVFHQKITRNQLLALLLTYTGIAIAYLGELDFSMHNTRFFWGSFLVFLCSVTYAVYIAGSGRLIPKVGAASYTAYAMLSATAGIFLHYSLQHGLTILYSSLHYWWYALLLAIVATVAPTFLLSLGMKRIGANNAAIISSIGPVSTIVQAHYFLGEPVFWQQIAGTALVLAGIIILSSKATD